MLRDTAKTTLQEQIANDPRAGSSPLASGGDAAGIDISNIFSNASNKWATIAFENDKN